MSAQFARAPHRGNPAPTLQQPPHAALLIDFDNVTMGIRSDLSKELKNLLSSDFIKGKVAVQRAYADWRRYPQYIVPLAESSVDLIFAPAYGSSKKNATDIRLAIDALELVFTRPEIGTYILLSGDSDFSSLVLKLKEYGKYVVGVGIRESASDLLVQNCDEYYSYSALTGLTRAGDEAAATAEDPWELVEMAIKQMVDNDDVMRSDRLKQVILEMDPSFDEKALGFQKFNRFMQEAASRGLVSLRKLENGQFEVGPPGAHPAEPGEAEDEEQRGNGRRRSRRGRGRDRDREGRRDREESRPREEVAEAEDVAVPEATPAAPPTAAVPPGAEPVATTEPPAAPPAPADLDDARAAGAEPDTAPPAARSRSRSGSRAARAPASPPAGGARLVPTGEPPRAAAAPGAPAAGEARLVPAGNELRASYDLLRRAVGELSDRGGEAARDSDVKRRMLELQPGWDEAPLGFSKFSRFLRQAHDAEVINLKKLDSGAYEVALAERDRGAASESRGRGRDRGRGRERTGETRARPLAAPEAGTQATRPAPASRPPRSEPVPQEELPLTPAAAAPRAAASSPPAAPTAVPAAAAARSLGIRRGSRGRVPSAPPPLLEGQTVTRSAAAAPPVAEPAAPAMPAPPAEDRRRAPRTPAKQARSGAGKANEGAPAAAKPVADVAVSSTAALPRDAAGVVAYLTAFKGVGPKSVQALVETFGPARVFQALEKQPNRVREIVPGARGERLLEAWRDDAIRRGQAAEPASAPADSAAPARRTRRGGRKRTAKPRA